LDVFLRNLIVICHLKIYTDTDNYRYGINVFPNLSAKVAYQNDITKKMLQFFYEKINAFLFLSLKIMPTFFIFIKN